MARVGETHTNDVDAHTHTEVTVIRLIRLILLEKDVQKYKKNE